MFPQFGSMKYKLFNLWRKYRYIKFVLSHNNMEWDDSGWVELNILKLTMMGLYFAKFGVIIDEEKKLQVRTIWKTRKALLDYQNSFDYCYAKGQEKFKEKYGVPYETGDMVWEPSSTHLNASEFKGIHVVSPKCNSWEEEKKISDYFHTDCFKIMDEYEREREVLKIALDTIYDKLKFWWD